MKPTNLAELMASLEAKFILVTGPPRAYFYIPLQHIALHPQTPMEEEEWSEARFTYQTLGFRISAINSERQLVEALFDLITNTVAQSSYYKKLFVDDQHNKPFLFWRRLPSIEFDPSSQQSVISCRLVIPGVLFEVNTEGALFPLLEVQS